MRNWWYYVCGTLWIPGLCFRLRINCVTFVKLLDETLFCMLFFNCDIRTLKSSAQLDMTASSSTWMMARGRAKKSRISWRPGEKSQSLPPSLTFLPQTLDVLTAIHSGKPSLVHSHITEGVLQLLKSFKKGKKYLMMSFVAKFPVVDVKMIYSYHFYNAPVKSKSYRNEDWKLKSTWN